MVKNQTGKGKKNVGFSEFDLGLSNAEFENSRKKLQERAKAHPDYARFEALLASEGKKEIKTEYFDPQKEAPKTTEEEEEG